MIALSLRQKPGPDRLPTIPRPLVSSLESFYLLVPQCWCRNAPSRQGLVNSLLRSEPTTLVAIAVHTGKRAIPAIVIGAVSKVRLDMIKLEFTSAFEFRQPAIPAACPPVSDESLPYGPRVLNRPLAEGGFRQRTETEWSDVARRGACGKFKWASNPNDTFISEVGSYTFTFSVLSLCEDPQIGLLVKLPPHNSPCTR